MKKVKIYYAIFLFVLSFIWHFGYKILSNNITAILFPVNESIWEHMKIIFGSFVFGSIFEKYLLKKYHINYNNFNIEIFIKAFLGVLLYLIIYIPIYFLFGENIVISIILLYLVFIAMEYIGEKILKYEELKINIMPIILIILCYCLFTILTFYPPHNWLFYDNSTFIYGING